MKICGLQKVTLLDYPGNVSCTVFLGGCNFNCGYCYNSSLINESNSFISIEEFFNFLDSRKGILDGVAITGGEPLLQKDIINFIKAIKNKGFKVKLDTNGSFPSVLKLLLDENLLDYVAMDIKNTFDKYQLTVDKIINLEDIKKSIDLLIGSNIDYEFRTTVVKEYHEPSDFVKIGEMIKGAKKYFIQCYQYQDSVRVKGLNPLTKDELILCLENIGNNVLYKALREID